jgi:hypothetical protein
MMLASVMVLIDYCARESSRILKAVAKQEALNVDWIEALGREVSTNLLRI